MNRLASAAAVVLTLAALSCRKPAPTKADAATAKSTDEVLGATLPGVVLLVNRHADGAIGFGSGVVLDDEGPVLTNLHVVSGGETLGALTYDPKRVSYIPQEGGLARYLFENDSLVMPARIVRGDPGLDLALVHINAPTKGLNTARPSSSTAGPAGNGSACSARRRRTRRRVPPTSRSARAPTRRTSPSS